jgi:predicted metalloendopeptidase
MDVTMTNSITALDSVTMMRVQVSEFAWLDPIARSRSLYKYTSWPVLVGWHVC